MDKWQVYDYRSDTYNDPPQQGEYLVTWVGWLGHKPVKFLRIIEWNDDWDITEIEKDGYRSVQIIAWMELPKAYGEG